MAGGQIAFYQHGLAGRKGALFEDRILGMTPFAVEIRYDEEFEPSIDEAKEALQTASEVHQLISAIVGRSEAEENRP